MSWLFILKSHILHWYLGASVSPFFQNISFGSLYSDCASSYTGSRSTRFDFCRRAEAIRIAINHAGVRPFSQLLYNCIARYSAPFSSFWRPVCNDHTSPQTNLQMPLSYRCSDTLNMAQGVSDSVQNAFMANWAIITAPVISFIHWRTVSCLQFKCLPMRFIICCRCKNLPDLIQIWSYYSCTMA